MRDATTMTGWPTELRAPPLYHYIINYAKCALTLQSDCGYATEYELNMNWI